MVILKQNKKEEEEKEEERIEKRQLHFIVLQHSRLHTYSFCFLGHLGLFTKIGGFEFKSHLQKNKKNN